MDQLIQMIISQFPIAVSFMILESRCFLVTKPFSMKIVPQKFSQIIKLLLDLVKDQIPSEVSNSATQRLNFSLSSVEGVTVLHERKRVSEDNVVGGNNGNENENGASLVPERTKFRASQPNFTPFHAEFSDAIVLTTSCAEVSIVICDNQEHQKEEVARSSMSFLSVAPSMLYPEDSSELLDDNLVGGSFNSMSGVRENLGSECSELQHPGIGSRLILKDMVKQNVQLASFSMLEAQKQENAALIVPTNNTQNDILDIGNFKGEKIDIQVGEERFFSPIETPQCKTFSEHQFGEFVQRSSSADMRCNDLTLKDDIPLEKKCTSSPTEGDGVTTTSNKSDELVGAVSDVRSDMHSPGTAIEEPDRKISDCQATNAENSSGDEKNLDSKSMVEHGSDLTASTSSAHHIAKNMKSGVPNNPIMGKMLPQSLQVSSKVSTVGLNSSCSELNGGKSQQGCVTSRTHLSRIFSASKASTSSTHISMLLTWHRTVSNSPASLLTSKPSVGTLPPKRSIPVKKGNLQNTSYSRKGNSLVRKPTTTAVLPQVSPVNQMPSSGLDESQKSNRSESRVDVPDEPNFLKTGVTNAPLERQRTPPLPIDTKSPNHATTSLEENRFSPAIEPFSYVCPKSALCAGKISEINDIPNSANDVLKCCRSLENQTGPSNDRESQIEENGGNVSPLNTNTIVYVKRKSNQLVATSSSCDVSVSANDKAQRSSSDGYYKRSKNELVRTAFEGQINQTVAMPSRNEKSDGQGACKVLCNKRFSKRRSHKVSEKSWNPLSLSLVWTLCGRKSRKVLPHLFPWKRATYLRSFIYNPAVSCISSYVIRYVRFGNDSQLIGDPKKRTRILANEKIRWSLHARQRLAQKKQYCQFFTRFGKCNKDGGKCPYIHDPSKIAVCTKFLNGLCSTPNCKLTHKVIPERMPDCSYFLQGLCTNRNCPYRHVNVNPKASICEQFLRGYCADGNECRKKHSYVCPTFEATGTFAQGNKCKLHHPKKPSKGKKRKRSDDWNSKGRYFGSIPIDLSEPGMMVAPPRQCQNDSFEGIGQAYKQAKSNDGGGSDYISLDVIEEDLAKSIGQAYKRAKFCDSDPMYLHLDNLDELIKPVRIIV